MTMTLDKRATASGAYGETGSFEWAETLLATNGRLSAEDLALVLETNQGKALTPTLNGYLIKLLRQPSGDYAVGYCTPPKHTQFRRGQSGHRGRRKRSGNLL